MAQTEAKLFNWIGGQRVAPRAAAYLKINGPCDGALLCEIPDSDHLDVVRAVQSANEALVEWHRTSCADRAAVLNRLADAVERDIEFIAMVDAESSGTPIKSSRERSVPEAVSAMRRAGRAACKPMEEFSRADGGISGLILPAFNSLLHLSRRLAAALAAGGAVIVKPSQNASASALHLGELALEAGLPNGLFNVVCGRGETVGHAIASHPAIRWLAFVGSSEIGWAVGREALEQGKRVQLSLGSRNAVIALDALSSASEAVRVMFAIDRPELRASRFFAAESVYSAAIDFLLEAARGLKVGDARDADTELGPLPSAGHLKRHQDQIAQAIKEQGKTVSAGHRLPVSGYYAGPEIFSEFSLCSSLQQDELLGPMVTASSVKYAHQAIARANASSYGQINYVWSQSPERALKTAGKLECGQVALAAGFPAAGEDFTPCKGSGHGEEGLDAWVRFFSWSQRILIGKRDV